MSDNSTFYDTLHNPKYYPRIFRVVGLFADRSTQNRSDYISVNSEQDSVLQQQAECMLENNQNKIQILLQKVGGESRYQFAIFLVFALKWMIAAMILFSLNFFYITPDFDCSKEGVTDQQACKNFVCSQENQQFWEHHLKHPLPRSIALDYGVIMVCSKQWISSLLQSLSYLGSLFGYIIMSHVGDNYGRKKGEYISWLICIAGQLITLFSVNLAMIGIGSFLLGFGANAAITLHYSFFKQLVLGETRSRMVIAIQLAFSLGITLISLLSYLIYEWKYTLAFFILIPSIVATFTFKLVQQTPEFTLKEGYEQFRQSFNRIARFNNNEQLQIQEVNQTLTNYSVATKQSEVNFLDLFRYKSLCYIAVICGIINFTIEFIFDGTLLSLDKFGLNVYFNQMLVGVVQITGAIFGAYIVPKVRRKQYITFAFIVIVAMTTLMGVQSLMVSHNSDELNYHTIIEMCLIAVLRFFINTAWGVFFVFVGQLFPTQVSSLSYGWTSIVGTVGASVSPYVRLVTADLTMFFMSILCVLNIFLVRTLDETKDQTVRSRIKEREQSNTPKDSVVSENN